MGVVGAADQERVVLSKWKNSALVWASQNSKIYLHIL